MIKLSKKLEQKGWSALKIELEKQGINGVVLEEAENSFYKGINVLAKLFLENYTCANKPFNNRSRKN
ncbi:MAG: hypothetical protein KBD53_09365 [Candidatus Omnitrophica bacterium]|nr:hypothetical protein [Candidatus Omnitrophota bacterium]